MAAAPGDGGRKARGRLGEEAALNLLERRGYRIVDTNVRFGSRSGLVGELDIVAWDGPTLCIVEVKARRTWRAREEVAPAESVTPAKQRRIARLALAYIVRSELGDDTPLRFDVVSVVLPPAGGDEGLIRRADLIQGAFLAPDDLREA